MPETGWKSDVSLLESEAAGLGQRERAVVGGVQEEVWSRCVFSSRYNLPEIMERPRSLVPQGTVRASRPLGARQGKSLLASSRSCSRGSAPSASCFV